MKTKTNNKEIKIEKENGKFYLTVKTEIKASEIAAIMDELEYKDMKMQNHLAEAQAGIL